MTLNKILTNPRVITAYVKASETVTAGDFVKADASSNDVVTSAGMSSYTAADIQVSAMDGATDYIYCVGIAGDDSTGTTTIAVYTEGLFIVKASEIITTGGKLQGSETASENTYVYNLDGASGDDTSYAEHCIGIALTGATDGGYLVMMLRI